MGAVVIGSVWYFSRSLIFSCSPGDVAVATTLSAVSTFVRPLPTEVRLFAGLSFAVAGLFVLSLGFLLTLPSFLSFFTLVALPVFGFRISDWLERSASLRSEVPLLNAVLQEVSSVSSSEYRGLDISAANSWNWAAARLFRRFDSSVSFSEPLSSLGMGSRSPVNGLIKYCFCFPEFVILCSTFRKCAWNLKNNLVSCRSFILKTFTCKKFPLVTALPCVTWAGCAWWFINSRSKSLVSSESNTDSASKSFGNNESRSFLVRSAKSPSPKGSTFSTFTWLVCGICCCWLRLYCIW